MFFIVHGCSDICRGLPKPTLAKFVAKIPDAKESAYVCHYIIDWLILPLL